MSPTIENVLVPLLSSDPTLLNSEGPFCITKVTLAMVSTLLMTVGFPHKPEVVGNGGRVRGVPLLPSIEAMRAVSSPQTNAPAPTFIFTSKLNPESRIFSPRNPASFI